MYLKKTADPLFVVDIGGNCWQISEVQSIFNCSPSLRLPDSGSPGQYASPGPSKKGLPFHIKSFEVDQNISPSKMVTNYSILVSGQKHAKCCSF